MINVSRIQLTNKCRMHIISKNKDDIQALTLYCHLMSWNTSCIWHICTKIHAVICIFFTACFAGFLKPMTQLFSFKVLLKYRIETIMMRKMLWWDCARNLSDPRFPKWRFWFTIANFERLKFWLIKDDIFILIYLQKHFNLNLPSLNF